MKKTEMRMNETRKTKNIPKPTYYGMNLRFLRRMHGMSQTKLATHLDMSRNNIASYESGVVEPNVKKFIATCQYFNISPKDMLETILSESPAKSLHVAEGEQGPIDTVVYQQMDSFVKQTNEMTKVYEGYKALYEMKKEESNYDKHRELYATLDNLIELLGSLVKSNWNLIQTVYPNGTEEE